MLIWLPLLALSLTHCAKSPGPSQVADGGSPHKTTAKRISRGSGDDIKPFYVGMSDASLRETSSSEKGDVIGAEVEAEIERATEDEKPQFDIPITINARVEKWLDYFQGRGRKVMKRWMERSTRYVPMMKRILRENGLPEDLIYLAMIESGFKPYAYSRARASGPWQFIKGTGRLYGLKVNWWIDERRDPEKSTIAAAQHLKDLYDQFNSWYLAAAGYNAGAAKITRAIKRYSTEDFWEMSKSKYRYLRHETKNYVPKMIAAALVAKDPARYGITDLKYHEPLQYDKVLVPHPTELSVIAQELGISRKDLQTLNPELRRGVTPPNMSNYELKVPVGLKKSFIAAYPTIRKKSISRVDRHVVRRGDSLWNISRAYGVSIAALKSFNQLRSSRLRPGQQLAIPYKGSGGSKRKARTVSYKPPKGMQASTYLIRRGDTLWSISRQFDVTVTQIRKWNGLGRWQKIFPGQKLKIYSDQVINSVDSMTVNSASTEKGWRVHRVRRGDTLWDIARRYGVTVADISAWNKLNGHKIKPGHQLKIKALGL